MYAIEELYKFVKHNVENIPEIKHFDWWNNNIENDGLQTPFPTPAVFFEINFITWENSTQGSVKNLSTGVPEQMGQGEFTLHIVHKKINSNSVDASELTHLNEVSSVFQSVHFSGFDQPFIEGAIQRVRDDSVLTHRVLRDWRLVFSVNLFECPLEDSETQEVDPWDADIVVGTEAPYLQGDGKITFILNETRR